MKRFLLSATAVAAILAVPSMGFAADLPRAAPMPAQVPVMVPAYNWTGFYIGGNIGYAWRSTDITGNFLGANWSVSNDKFIGGGQMGYNWQFGQFVFGIEGDFDWASGSKTSPLVNTGAGPLQASVDGNWVSTVAARLRTARIPVYHARSLAKLAIAEAMLAAGAWGARRSWFLVNGASGGNHAACMALAHLGSAQAADAAGFLGDRLVVGVGYEIGILLQGFQVLLEFVLEAGVFRVVLEGFEEGLGFLAELLSRPVLVAVSW